MDTYEADLRAPQHTTSIIQLRTHPLRMLVVFGTPVAFAITGFLHLVPWPSGSELEVYTRLRDHATLWIAIHVVQLLLILLLAVAVSWLTEGLSSTAARVSRIALLPYLVFYSAFDSIVGVSRGLVAHYGSQLSSVQQAALPGVIDALASSWSHPFSPAVPFTIGLIASLAWAVAVVAAAIALRQAGAPWTATISLGLAGAIGAIDHAAPYGPIAMALFLVAAGMLSRPQKLPQVPQPESA